MSLIPKILFRRDGDNRDEFAVARQFFPITTLRSNCRENLVIGRYSVLPYYNELVFDLSNQRSQLINLTAHHFWVAEALYHTVPALQPFLPRAWDDETFPRSTFPGPFVVKGKTNSRKHQWSQKMYAADRHQAIRVAIALRDDPFIGPQGLLYREYIPLRSFGEGLNGLPWANEWRFFYLGRRRLAYGYYWSEAEGAETRSLGADGITFADTIARVVAAYVPFFVLDIAERADGGWILIEINDGQCSGLSLVPPDILYANLAEALREGERDALPNHAREGG